MITKLTDGLITLRANISNTACGSVAFTKDIVVGFPNFNGSVEGTDMAEVNGLYYFSIYLPFYYITQSYQWRVAAGWTIISEQGTNQIFAQVGTTGGEVEVELTSCGKTISKYKYVGIGGGGYIPAIITNPEYRIKVSPNPAGSTVQLVLQPLATKAKDDNYSIETLTISDKIGNIKKEYSFKKRQLRQSVDISFLPADIYTFTVYDGHTFQTTPVVVTK